MLKSACIHYMRREWRNWEASLLIAHTKSTVQMQHIQYHNEFPCLRKCGLRYLQCGNFMFLVVACHVAQRNRSIRNFQQIEWKTKPRKLARQFTITSNWEIRQRAMNGWPLSSRSLSLFSFFSGHFLNSHLFAILKEKFNRNPYQSLVREFIWYFSSTFIASFDVTNWKLSDFHSSFGLHIDFRLNSTGNNVGGWTKEKR